MDKVKELGSALSALGHECPPDTLEWLTSHPECNQFLWDIVERVNLDENVLREEEVVQYEKLQGEGRLLSGNALKEAFSLLGRTSHENVEERLLQKLLETDVETLREQVEVEERRAEKLTSMRTLLLGSVNQYHRNMLLNQSSSLPDMFPDLSRRHENAEARLSKTVRDLWNSASQFANLESDHVEALLGELNQLSDEGKAANESSRGLCEVEELSDHLDKHQGFSQRQILWLKVGIQESLMQRVVEKARLARMEAIVRWNGNEENFAPEVDVLQLREQIKEKRASTKLQSQKLEKQAHLLAETLVASSFIVPEAEERLSMLAEQHESMSESIRGLEEHCDNSERFQAQLEETKQSTSEILQTISAFMADAVQDRHISTITLGQDGDQPDLLLDSLRELNRNISSGEETAPPRISSLANTITSYLAEVEQEITECQAELERLPASFDRDILAAMLPSIRKMQTLCSPKGGFMRRELADSIHRMREGVETSSVALDRIQREKKSMARRVQTNELGHSQEERRVWVDFWKGSAALANSRKRVEEIIEASLFRNALRKTIYDDD